MYSRWTWIKEGFLTQAFTFLSQAMLLKETVFEASAYIQQTRYIPNTDTKVMILLCKH